MLRSRYGFGITDKPHSDHGFFAWLEFDTLDEAHKAAKEEIAKGNRIFKDRIEQRTQEVKYHTV